MNSNNNIFGNRMDLSNLPLQNIYPLNPTINMIPTSSNDFDSDIYDELEDFIEGKKNKPKKHKIRTVHKKHKKRPPSNNARPNSSPIIAAPKRSSSFLSGYNFYPLAKITPKPIPLSEARLYEKSLSQKPEFILGGEYSFPIRYNDDSMEGFYVNNNNSTLQYDYNDIKIKVENIREEVVSGVNNVCLYTPLNYSDSNPNLYYPKGNNKYRALNIRLHSLIHNNIRDVTCNEDGTRINPDIVGEMVIEHQNIVDSSKRLYLCFLLKKQNINSKTNVDKILGYDTNSSGSINLSLLSDFPASSNCLEYEDGDKKTVLVFMTPIRVNEYYVDKLTSYTSNSLFSITPANDTLTKVIPSVNISVKTDDDIYIDCQPTGESAETIATYNVPINSEFTKDAQQIYVMKTTIQLIIVVFLIFITYFMVPILYKITVVDNITKFLSEISGEDCGRSDKCENALLTRIASIDYVVLAILSVVILMFCVYGFRTQNFAFILYGIYMLLFSILSVIIIKIRKNDTEFLNNFEYPKGDKPGISTAGILYDLPVFLAGSLKYMVSGHNVYVPITSIVLSVLYELFLVILVLTGFILRWNHMASIWYQWFVPFIFIIVAIVFITNERGSGMNNIIKMEIIDGIKQSIPSAIKSSGKQSTVDAIKNTIDTFTGTIAMPPINTK